MEAGLKSAFKIIPYQAITGNNNVNKADYLLPCLGGLNINKIPHMEKNTTQIGTKLIARKTAAAINARMIRIIINKIIRRSPCYVENNSTYI